MALFPKNYFDIYPKVVQEGVPTTITICPKNQAAAFKAEAYFVALIPTAYQTSYFIRNWDMIDQVKVVPRDGKLVFTYRFPRQQEYAIWMFAAEEQDRDLEKKPKIFEVRTFAELRVYALEEELYRRRPLVGDMHLHSTGSDGLEDAHFVAAQYRKAGYDFISLSDHHSMAPSLQLIKDYEDLEMGLSLFPAEEVHGMDNTIHVLNFGGKYSVNKIFQDDPDRYYREIADLQKEWEPKLPEGVSSFLFCSCLWEANEIRKAGGLAVLAHPMRRWPLQYVNEPTLNTMLEHNVFDAMDIGDGSLQTAMRQVARWNDARAKGCKIAITGIDDCHSTVANSDFTAAKTIVLAEEATCESIIRAIQEGYNAVVHQVQITLQDRISFPSAGSTGREQPHVFGTYPIVDYVQFLLEEYFPLHDELAAAEGQRIHDYNNGDPAAAEDIARISCRAAALEAKYFGRT